MEIFSFLPKRIRVSTQLLSKKCYIQITPRLITFIKFWKKSHFYFIKPEYNILVEYSLTLNTWKKIEIPQNNIFTSFVYWPKLVQYSPTNIIIMGGGSDKSMMSAVDSNYDYNLSTNTIVLKTPMPLAKYTFGMVLIMGWVYVVGGCPDYNRKNNNFDRYHSQTDKWEQLPNLRIPTQN